MALIRCTECGREVSDKAMACPGCGCLVTKSVREASVVVDDALNKSYVLLTANTIALILYCLIVYRLFEPSLNRKILHEFYKGYQIAMIYVPLVLGLMTLPKITTPSNINKIVSGVFYLTAIVVYMLLYITIVKMNLYY